jgi:branched-chain amino acid transport system ATP-binding protein
MRAPAESDIAAGEIMLLIENVSLSFGGVRAIRDVATVPVAPAIGKAA